MMSENLKRQLCLDEGIRRTVYKDHLGFDTIGVGRLVDSRKPGGLRLSEINYMLANDIEDRKRALSERLSWFDRLDEARQGVLLNMAFQLGTDGLLAFSRTLSSIRVGDYERAAKEMLESRWAKQTPERAGRMAEQMRSGVWQFAE